MITKRMEEAFNGQLNKELYSAYLYMAMSSYSDSVGLKGFANWFMVQYHEEMLHAMKIHEYIRKQGGKVRLVSIAEPPADFESPLDMFEKTLAHERFITRSINDLVDLSISEKDHASHIFLQWYVTEQIEEEQNDTDIIAQLKLVGTGPESNIGLFLIDKELATLATTVLTDFSKGIDAGIKAAGQA